LYNPPETQGCETDSFLRSRQPLTELVVEKNSVLQVFTAIRLKGRKSLPKSAWISKQVEYFNSFSLLCFAKTTLAANIRAIHLSPSAITV
jgi:hypothetical protein